MKVCVLTDFHCKKPESDLQDSFELLKKAVVKMNREIKPDLVLLLGDLISTPNDPNLKVYYSKIVEIMKNCATQWSAIPGNHDIETAEFFKIFPKFERIIDICGVRFVFLLDAWEPNSMARRPKKELEEIGKARSTWKGMLVTVQHISLFPPGSTSCPYNLVNADEVVEEQRKYNVSLALSGHYHPGFSVKKDDCYFISTPSLGATPYQFSLITIEKDRIEGRLFDLAAKSLQSG